MGEIRRAKEPARRPRSVFENEPANLNAMVEAFPLASAVFLDTIHSPRPDVPSEASQWVGDFRVDTDQCRQGALRSAFQIYKDECGGFGRRSACNISENQAPIAGGDLRVTCGFSGEPDYSDYLDVEFFLDSQTCAIRTQKIHDCYND